MLLFKETTVTPVSEEHKEGMTMSVRTDYFCRGWDDAVDLKGFDAEGCARLQPKEILEYTEGYKLGSLVPQPGIKDRRDVIDASAEGTK